jgi:hypothetical protein
MSKKHAVRNSQFMKVMRDAYFFFQEESHKVKNKHGSTTHSDNGTNMFCFKNERIYGQDCTEAISDLQFLRYCKNLFPQQALL